MKLFTCLILFLISARLFAPAPNSLVIIQAEAVKDNSLLLAIIQIESGGGPYKINFQEQAIGLLQIRKIMLKEINHIVGYDKYTVKDCLDSLKSIEMYWVAQSCHNPEYDLKRACLVWNGKSRNNKYYEKVKKYINTK